MSVCRFAEGSCDVYMYPTGGGKFECCGCRLQPDEGTVVLDDIPSAMSHLYSHLSAGQRVPEYAFSDLRGRAASNRSTIPGWPQHGHRALEAIGALQAAVDALQALRDAYMAARGYKDSVRTEYDIFINGQKTLMADVIAKVNAQEARG